jgi:serine/threonine-protein kinase RsbW
MTSHSVHDKPTSTPSVRARRAGKIHIEKDKLALRFYDVIPSTLQALDEVIETLMILAREMKCDSRRLEEVELALREALANAVIHGNQQDPDKNIVVRCFCQPDRGMLLIVEDEGMGFNPSQVPNPTHAECLLQTHGRGLFLMKRLMDHVRISRRGRHGTRVTLLKRLKTK